MNRPSAERQVRQCEEIRAYDGTAERTGSVVDLRVTKSGQRTCTSITDLIRKYKLFGDGLFYLPTGMWPVEVVHLELDNLKWKGLQRVFEEDERNRRVFHDAADEERS